MITYPKDCTTVQDKNEFLMRSQELLRQLHNKFSKWNTVGLSKVEYDNFPKEIKDEYPYSLTIAPVVQREFIKNTFNPRSDDILNEICINRAELKALYKESDRWDIDVMNLKEQDKDSILSSIVSTVTSAASATWNFLTKPL